MKKTFFAVAAFAAITFLGASSCNKNTTTEDPHNHSLLTKSLDEIKAEIRGDWYICYSGSCGFAGCYTNYYPIASAGIMSFLTNDSLKQTGHSGTPIYFYEKADSIKKVIIGYLSEPAWTFYFPSRAIAFVRKQSDTLVGISENGSEFGLIKKQ